MIEISVKRDLTIQILQLSKRQEAPFALCKILFDKSSEACVAILSADRNAFNREDDGDKNTGSKTNVHPSNHLLFSLTLVVQASQRPGCSFSVY